MRNANSSPDFTFEIPRVVQGAPKVSGRSPCHLGLEKSGSLRAKPSSAEGSLASSSHREHQLGLAFAEIRCHTVHFAKIE